MSPCLLNFGYLNPATYVNNNLVVMFLTFAGQSRFDLWEDNVFAWFLLSSRRSGDSSLGFRAGNL